MSNAYDLAVSLLTDPKHTRWLAPLLILGEAALSFLIIAYVPYTEIDYSTYMVQVHQYLQHGEHNYAKITGPSGPLVYPAMHVWIYSVLYYLTTTRDVHGDIVDIDVEKAQLVFAGLYLVTLAIVIACYRRVNAPPWLLVPLVLSKRLHSIFLLRLFNDGWATFSLWLTIYTMHRRIWPIAVVFWSLGVGVKMTVLLAAPAVGLIILQGLEAMQAYYLGFASVGVQIIIAVPFLEAMKGGDYVAYLKRAFEFNRVFLYKWTVNWRFIGETRFVSKEWALGLLVLHISLLAAFAHARWVRISTAGLQDFFAKFTKEVPEAERESIEQKLTPTYVMDTMLTAMLIGLLCARSLHYQFYAYIGWATPYLLWRGTGSMVITLGVCAAQELAWLVFPSTDTSSMVVVGCLVLQVVSAFASPPVDGIAPPAAAMEKLQQRMESSQDDKKSS